MYNVIKINVKKIYINILRSFIETFLSFKI